MFSTDQPYDPSGEQQRSLSGTQEPIAPRQPDDSGPGPEGDTKTANLAPAQTENGRRPSFGIPRGQAADTGGNVIDKDQRGDRSEIIWSLYLDQAKMHDKEVTENMKDDTNGVLVFTGLFAAVVATFIIESYKSLQPDSADATVALLSHISKQLAAAANGTQLPLPSFPIPDAPAPFRPHSSVVRVNILWFISLLLSVLCALAATLMQQWARRYMSRAQSTQRAGSPERQGLIHAYLFFGLQSFHVQGTLEALPALIHASVILFFAGLVEFMLPINALVAYVILTFVVIAASLYLSITFLPMQYERSPYATPFSSICTVAYSVIHTGLSRLSLVLNHWVNSIQAMHPPFGLGFILALTVRAVFGVVITIASSAEDVCNSMLNHLPGVKGDSLGALQDAANHTVDLVPQTVNWTFMMITDDIILFERFFEGLPSFIARSEESHRPAIVDALSSSAIDVSIYMLLETTTSDYHGIVVRSSLTRTQRALSYLRSFRELVSLSPSPQDSFQWPALLSGITWPLRNLREDSDPDIVVSASCTTATMVFFLEKFVQARDWYVGDDRQMPEVQRESLRFSQGCLAGRLTQSPSFWCSIPRTTLVKQTQAYYLMGRLWNASAFVAKIVPHLSLASAETLSLVWITIEGIPEPLLDEEFEIEAREWSHMDDFERELEELRSRIAHIADDHGIRKWDDHITQLASPPESSYKTLYEKLCPLDEWMFRFQERRCAHRAERAISADAHTLAHLSVAGLSASSVSETILLQDETRALAGQISSAELSRITTHLNAQETRSGDPTGDTARGGGSDC